MARIVSYEDIEQSNPDYISVGATPTRVLLSRLGLPMRTLFSIVPLTAGVTVTVTLGPVNAAANYGVNLTASQPFTQAIIRPGEPDGCYQGEVWVTASGPGFISLQETFEQGGLQ